MRAILIHPAMILPERDEISEVFVIGIYDSRPQAPASGFISIPCLPIGPIPDFPLMSPRFELSEPIVFSIYPNFPNSFTLSPGEKSFPSGYDLVRIGFDVR